MNNLEFIFHHDACALLCLASQLGACAVAKLLPRAHELWLRGLPSGRLGELSSKGEQGLCPASPGSTAGLMDHVHANAPRTEEISSAAQFILFALVALFLVLSLFAAR